MADERTSYDALPYPSHPYPQTHPDHLATLAKLLGLDPVPPSRCRVLELGCASGGNLMPMALTLSDSEFVGIDLSGEQIAEGKQNLERLQLKNIRLEQLSILDVDERLGTFDYILCHGVYSWIPDEVQDKILSICAEQLSPRGIAYISYNTLPGWHMRGMIRDMMQHHVARFRDATPLESVGQARALLDFLARSVRQNDNPYGLQLRKELELLQQHSDSYLFHEHLEERNTPIYFWQFAERLAAKGLQYLGEAEFNVMVPATAFAPEVQEGLNALAPDLLQMEQYMDFLRNRQFRQSLICSDSLKPRYDLHGEHLFDLRLASALQPKAPPVDLAGRASASFVEQGGLTLTAIEPIVKAALLCLGEIWPASLTFWELLDRARQRAELMDESRDTLAHAMGKAFLKAYGTAGNRLVELSLEPRPFVVSVSEKPLASPIARLQSESTKTVTTLRHETANLMPFDCHLVQLLDGTRNREQLIEGMLKRWRDELLSVSIDDENVTDEAKAREVLTDVLDNRLPTYPGLALLCQ